MSADRYQIVPTYRRFDVPGGSTWGISGWDVVDGQTATLICTTGDKDHAELVIRGLNYRYTEYLNSEEAIYGGDS
jgi:hypothetical protein